MPVTLTTIDQFDVAIDRVEKAHKLQFYPGKRESLINKLKKENQLVNGNRFRNHATGGQVDIDKIIIDELTNGYYTRLKPGIREKYQSPFPTRDEGTKRVHANFTKSFLKKALETEGIVFLDAFKDKAAELISNNFLVGDDENGLAFSRIIDSDIGVIGSNERFYLNAKYDSKKSEKEQLKDLINHLQIGKWIDWDATKISQLQHKASLRQLASGMVPAGSKPADVENIIGDLEKFEKRSLRTGKALPVFNKVQIDEEFRKFSTLNGYLSGGGSSTSVNKIDRVDDLSDLVNEARKVVVQPEVSQHEGF